MRNNFVTFAPIIRILTFDMAEYIETDIDNQEEESSNFNFRTFITIMYLNWYWILLSTFICITGAMTYLRYTPTTFSASMKVLIKDANEGGGRRGFSTNTLEEMGVISTSNGFENELEILSSTAIAKRVVRSLKLYTAYYLEGKVKDRELYKNSPILVDIEASCLDTLEKKIELTIHNKRKGIHVEGYVGSEKYAFKKDIPQLPGSIQTQAGVLTFERNSTSSTKLEKKELYVTIYPLVDAARMYASQMIASAAKTGTTTSNIRITDTQPLRALDYLKQLMISYNDDANEDKNEVARKTEQFIVDRIEVIQQELDSTEANLEVFKKANELINLPNNATTALSNTTSYQKAQVEMETQLVLIQSLIDYTDDPDNMLEIIPINLGLSNAQLHSTITHYNSLAMQRKRLLKASTEGSPAVVKLTAQMEDIWPTIGYSLRTYHQDLLVKKNSIDNQYNMFNQRIANTPTQERILNNIGRQQEIKAGLYLMLLQKREQNLISLASTATKARIIDEPKPNGIVSPNKSKILAGGAAFGFVFPIVLIYILGMLRYRIEGREDVERLTQIPILADIPMAKMPEGDTRGLVVNENKNNMMEEAFRGLRTNLRFILSNQEKVIVCTSCIPGEGKTFVASNLAMSLSLLGKRVILVGLDIRKPRLGAMFKLEKQKKGITTFLMLDEPDYDLLEDQISHEVVNKNLDLLPAGIIPPNPTELISRPLLDDAINYLRTKYDYIILDTPPIGLVSDTLELGRTADTTIFVARADYSIKANFSLINTINKDKKMKKINLVLNGIDLKKRKYGYYYGYGKYSSYSHRGKYGYYGKYSHYGHYGVYGSYRYSSGTESNE